MKILITGASGFIGSFIVEEALRRGFETWAAVRGSSSRQFLTDERIHFIELNLSSEEQLCEQLKDHQFDYVVHAAGVTKCLNKADFHRINTEGTQHLVRAIIALKMPLRRFVYISSLSIMGAIREQQPYTEILESDEARPNTAYGRSKLEAEQWLADLPSCTGGGGGGFPYVILRPTGVYGPRERDYFMMAKSIPWATSSRTSPSFMSRTWYRPYSLPWKKARRVANISSATERFISRQLLAI